MTEREASANKSRIVTSEFDIEWEKGKQSHVKLISGVTLEEYFQTLRDLEEADVLVFSSAKHLRNLIGVGRSMPSVIYTDGSEASYSVRTFQLHSRHATYVAWVGKKIDMRLDPPVNLYLLTRYQMTRVRISQNENAPNVRLHSSHFGK